VVDERFEEACGFATTQTFLLRAADAAADRVIELEGADDVDR
jgi:hypothetical protein